MKQSRRNPHKGGHAGQAHKSAQTTMVCADRAACARQQGVSRARKAAHNSPRQSAWVVVFVGVFADVCRLFGLVCFGGLGVFGGVWRVFLFFDIFGL